MKFLTLENIYKKQGYNIVAGIDEVGRGALAGPLVAGAVVLPARVRLPGLTDSKLLSQTQRERLSQQIIEAGATVAFGEVSAEEIDDIGIAAANKLAFVRALSAMRPTPHFALADYFTYTDLPCPSRGVAGGDKLVRSIAAASIVAKVYRDALMKKYHDEYPQYGFDTHVGYGTARHRAALKKHNLSSIHRRSFIHFV